MTITGTAGKDVLDLDIAANKLTYTGQPLELVTLSGTYEMKTGDKAVWIVDGQEQDFDKIPAKTDAGKYSVTLRVEREYFQTFEKTVSVSIALATLDLEGLVIEANDLTYTGEEQETVTVKANPNELKLSYSLKDEEHWQEEIPVVVDAGSYVVYVRVSKENHATREYSVYPINVTVTKAKITGVKAEGYTGTYDKKEHTAVTVTGQQEGDVVTFAAKKGDKENFTLSESPKVKNVVDSGVYHVRIDRGSNYDVLILDVTVTIAKEGQTLTFKDSPTEVVYGENNTFTVTAQKSVDDKDEGTIVYTITEGEDIATVDDNGLVTFTGVGTVTIEADLTDLSNYTCESVSHTVKIKYPATPEYTVSAPVFTDADGKNWHKDPVVIEPADGWLVIKDSNAQGQSAWAENVTEAAEGAYNIKVAFKNETSGEITDLVEIPAFAIDKTIPHDLEVTFNVKHDGIVAKVIHFLSFGLFCKEEVLVTVECNDDAATEGAPNSGIASIQLFKDPGDGTQEEIALKNGTDNQFVLPVGFVGTVKVQLTDKAGNTTGKVLVNKENSNLGDDDGNIMIEQVAPVVSQIQTTPAEGVNKEDGANRFSGDVEVSFTAQDVDSGLYSIELALYKGNIEDYLRNYQTENGSVSINEALLNIDADDLVAVTLTEEGTVDRAKAKDLQQHTFKANTADMAVQEDGSYNLVATVIDNAGNVTRRYLRIEKDCTAPVISDFKFAVAEQNVEAELAENIQITDYGYYFKTDVVVTITANDPAVKNEVMSGVKTITVVLVDVDGTYYTVTEAGELKAITDIAAEAVARPVDKNNSVSFTIKQNFKGQVYAFATDRVDNNPTKGGDGTDPLFGYVHPYGNVVENADKHTETSSIAIGIPVTKYTENETCDYTVVPEGAQKDKTMDYDASQPVLLYTEDPTFIVTATDTYSGIRSVKITLIENGEVVDEDVVTIDNAGNLDSEEWSDLRRDNNLVTKITKEYTATGNFNNMVLVVELTDRAGNVSYDYTVFGIDKTAPQIHVDMTGTMDAKYPGFFSTDREATITVKERNFIENAEFSVIVTDEKGKKTEITIDPTAFEAVCGEDGKPVSEIVDGIEYYTYKLVTTFDVDGDYTFAVQATDLVNRTTDTFVSDENQYCAAFTIDKVKPTISVSYDNNSAENEKYFKDYRTATVTIVEHNFPIDENGQVDYERIVFTQTAERGGKIPAPAWKHNGVTHIATFKYTADGDYTFDVTVKDLAGNSDEGVKYGSSVAPDDFVIDTTYEDMITITGVENGVAYGHDAEVVPEIKIFDINLHEYTVSLTGVQKDKTIDLTDDVNALLNAGTDTVTGIFDIFKTKQDLDGIYTLKVTSKDKAGNEDSEQVVFTVNRFGSVYVFEDYLLNLVKDGGAFVQKVESDLIITEYNADKLLADSLKIEITVDGKPLENVSYTVTPEINDTVSVGSSGWYQYKYTISKDNFKTDGVYKISIASEDATGNTPENSNYDDKAMTFRVDSTRAEIPSIVGLEKAIINAQEITVKYTVFDTIGIKSIIVYVDDVAVAEIVDFTADPNNYSGSFKLAESRYAQSVRIVVEDMAGNITDTAAESFAPAYEFNGSVTVSTNIFVRWYANKGLFWGSIGGVVVIAAALWIFLANKKKKEELK